MNVVIVQVNGHESRCSRRWSAAGEASVVAMATNGVDIISTVLEEEPDFLILGPRLDSRQGLGVLHAVRPLLPVLRVVALGDRRSGEVRRAFLLGDTDLLLTGPDWARHVRSSAAVAARAATRVLGALHGSPAKKSRMT